VAAVGATDQHSQVQLFMEGPFDKVITLVRVERHGEDVTIPSRSDLPPTPRTCPGRRWAGCSTPSATRPRVRSPAWGACTPRCTCRKSLTRRSANC
jgi:hypothetical protein